MKRSCSLINLIVILLCLSFNILAGSRYIIKSSMNQKKTTILRVKLLGPLSTRTGKCGDEVVVRVVAPEENKGDILEGFVTESKSGGSIKGKSELTFVFQTHVHNNESKRVKSILKSITNSKGQEMVDEEGNVVKKENNLKSVIGKSILGGLAGAAIGAVVAGGEGAAIGAAAGAGTAAITSVVYIKYKVQGANVAFDAGSEMLVEVQDCENCKPFQAQTCSASPRIVAKSTANSVDIRPTITRRPRENEQATISSIQKPEKPSNRFRTYKQGNLFEVSVPNNWRRIPEGDNMDFAPNGGYSTQGATITVEYGVRIGVIQLPGDTVEQGMKHLMNSLSKAGKGSQQVGNAIPTGFAGRGFLGSRLRRESTVPNRMEIIDVYLTKLSNGSFLYFITSVPDQHYPEYLETFLRIRSGIQINDAN